MWSIFIHFCSNFSIFKLIFVLQIWIPNCTWVGNHAKILTTLNFFPLLEHYYFSVKVHKFSNFSPLCIAPRLFLKWPWASFGAKKLLTQSRASSCQSLMGVIQFFVLNFLFKIVYIIAFHPFSLMQNFSNVLSISWKSEKFSIEFS